MLKIRFKLGLAKIGKAEMHAPNLSPLCFILNYVRDLLLGVENLLLVVAWYQFAAQLIIPRGARILLAF